MAGSAGGLGPARSWRSSAYLGSSNEELQALYAKGVSITGMLEVQDRRGMVYLAANPEYAFTRLRATLGEPRVVWTGRLHCLPTETEPR